MEYSSNIERAKNFILTLSLNGTIDQLAMAINVRWYGHVLR